MSKPLPKLETEVDVRKELKDIFYDLGVILGKFAAENMPLSKMLDNPVALRFDMSHWHVEYSSPNNSLETIAIDIFAKNLKDFIERAQAIYPKQEKFTGFIHRAGAIQCLQEDLSQLPLRLKNCETSWNKISGEEKQRKEIERRREVERTVTAEYQRLFAEWEERTRLVDAEHRGGFRSTTEKPAGASPTDKTWEIPFDGAEDVEEQTQHKQLHTPLRHR